MAGLRWQDMTVGDTLTTGARTITETDLVTFVTSAGFFEPLFLDARAVAADSPYTGRLVPGALTFVFAEGLVIQTGVIHGTGLAFLGTDLRVVAPVYVGDTIDVAVEVTMARASRTPGRGVVTTTNRVRNQRGEEVLVYSPTRLVRGRDGE
ncbi:MAG TPA: MaoC family dehydratase N-terminal domain-containing protein [Acidimicrobiales bacterium]|nr:MaoC family dehydratase N-terminal domain-containing protein [Acidimicrobiales bacterium]